MARILVIDDDAAFRDGLAETLRDFGPRRDRGRKRGGWRPPL